MSTCTITFSAVDPALAVLPNAELVFSPYPAVVRGAGAQVMAPNDRRVVANASGAGSVDLAPGAYILTMTAAGGSKQAQITVPATGTALLGDLIGADIGAWEFSELQSLRTDVATAAGQVATDRGVVAADRVLAQNARADTVAAAPAATAAAAQALIYRDQAAIYAGSFAPGMIFHRPDEIIPAGWYDTGLRQVVTDLLGGTSTLALISNWTYASLFAGGVATTVFDFTTLGRMFSDLSGTAVTTPGQSVAMTRDAITPPTFGPNLVSNGSFATDTVWGKGGPLTISGGQANKAAGGPTSLTQVLALTGGRTHRISGDVVVTAAGTLTPRLIGGATASATAISASGSFERFVTANTGNTTLDLQGSAAFAGTIDNIRVEEVLGVVAPQANIGAQGKWALRPITGRRNLLANSDNPADLAFVKTAVATGAGLLADDGRRAVIPSAASIPPAQRFIGHSIGNTYNGQSLTYSVDLWPNGYGFAFVGFFDRVGVYAVASVNLSTGLASAMQIAGAAVTSATVTTTAIAGGGWRVTIAAAIGTAMDLTAWVGVSPHPTGTAPTTAWTGDGVSGVDIARPQFERGLVATAYQAVTFDDLITETGVRNSGRWRSDMTDDALVFNLPAVGDGELVLIGEDGAYRETRLAAAGATITIGGITAGTLATPGILRYTGPLLYAHFRPTPLSANEALQLGRRFRPEGGGGWPILGPNLLVNGGFDSASNWTLGTGWGIAGGIATHGPGTQSDLVQSIAVTAGQSYLLNYDVVAVRALGILSVCGAALIYSTLEGTPTVGVGKRAVWMPSSSGEFRLRLGATADIDIDNLSLRLMTPEW